MQRTQEVTTEDTPAPAEGSKTQVVDTPQVAVEQVRKRLLELPEVLRKATTRYLERTYLHAQLETAHAYRRAEIFLDGVQKKEGEQNPAISGKNAETRDAELLHLLHADKRFTQLVDALQKAKMAQTASSMELQNLRQEADIQMAVLRSIDSVLQPLRSSPVSMGVTQNSWSGWELTSPDPEPTPQKGQLD